VKPLRLISQYLPFFAIATAIALIVAFAPSRPTSTSDSLGADAGFGSGQSGAPAPTGGTGGATSGTAVGSSTGASGTSPGVGGAPGSVGAPGAGGGYVGGAVPGSAVQPGAAGADCSRNSLVAGPTCRPSWNGTSNGGATGQGVTQKAINIVVYVPFRNAQVSAVLSANGTPSADDQKDVADTLAAYFNKVFQLYGRQVKIIFQNGPGQSGNPSQMIADAQQAAVQEHAFMVIAAAADEAFYTELARRHVPSIAVTLQLRDSYYQQHAPYVYNLLQSGDYVTKMVSEYACKRLAGGKAVHAGDTTYQSSDRKFGIFYPNGTGLGPLLKNLMDSCGAKVTGPVIGYDEDVSTAVQQATNAVTQMHAANVTSAICICSLLAPTFFTQQAQKQDWYPEWIENGYGLTDAPGAGRVYDQTEWQHAFGPSLLGFPQLLATSAGWKVYFKQNPSGNAGAVKRAINSYYLPMLYAFSAIEAAGPNLNALSFARALQNIPAFENGRDAPTRVSFGDARYGAYTAADDAVEIWYCATCTAPDGKPGTNYYVAGGKRFVLGQWPSGAPKVFVSDGSHQPPRDPNQ
jgi:hypothetical protein